jgi:Tol biopolymer transport system component
MSQARSLDRSRSLLITPTLLAASVALFALLSAMTAAIFLAPDKPFLTISARIDKVSDFDIYIIDLATRIRYNLSHHNLHDTSPVWTADGKSLAYICNRGGQRILCVYDADAQRVIELSESNGVAGNPSWSPDGSQLAYVGESRDSVLSRDVYVIDVDGGDARTITATSHVDYNPIWSPDGAQIVYLTVDGRLTSLYLTDLNTGETRLLVQQRGLDFVGEMTWSPDGDYIASTWQAGAGYEIRLIDPIGNETRTLALGNAYNRYPAWAPDGKRLAFVSSPTLSMSGPLDVYVVSLADEIPLNLTGGAVRASSPQWLPDGETIAFMAADASGGSYDTPYMVDVSGENLRALALHDFVQVVSPAVLQ